VFNFDKNITLLHCNIVSLGFNVVQVRFQFFTAASTKTVFWDVDPCSLVEGDRRFIALMMEAVNISETSVSYETTRLNIPEHRRHLLTFQDDIGIFALFNDALSSMYVM
jgi:hypothetical protein